MANNKRKDRKLFTIFTILMLLFVGTLLYIGFKKQAKELFGLYDGETSFRMYPGFAIKLPQGYNIHGIDVSRYQKNINWQLVKEMKSKDVKIGFAFIKATEGLTVADPKFARNWRNSKENNMYRGAYHFYRPQSNPRKQAEFFISKVKLSSNDLPPVLDIEVLGDVTKVNLQKDLQIFLDILENYYGVKPIIYTNASFYNTYLWPKFDDYPLWVAHYLQPNAPRVKRDWSIWQHNESGRVNGINAFVDFNVFNGDSSDFKKLLIP